ncbi:MAG: 16S rRNA (guanine(527)-N(7))-methyltransferase RsmG [Rhodospirillaceae bacterium]|jgi:16S rRNA (guanine527-N7)-methyltransferase|nr:16S rRNA (guanine(527)-N(7))-methyltransferase RsmG [Rhodospirillaceae bacterium]MBT3886149.1 16S rRNA (guanine(527)-N(7))-methyltransferase RsmG [Rhodospirillaceae bacterium]MBT4118220.1 16S rRNA (guanine(527)-N(7))-methyltransferase RsmG [Rhodospirillaceae bacterium]MBT4673063.1 16S rRNA (guanine(527)-N(7))-methyltransferase RsmG [Rhodospirillaceae bacterium]MBT4721335.1 16S rRNA (guanine(527)-N(7))-methyltransferase RsmG [Rhodospirillaceae bacterium]
MTGTDIDPQTLSRLGNVSRETLDRLKSYVDHLSQWQSKLNLIGSSEINHIWDRHILDCAQLIPMIKPIHGSKLDLGSGAGFPGMVLAILGVSDFTLIESNTRKCVFLRQAARLTETSAEIFDGRVEDYKSTEPARVITARALAPLDKLFAMAHPLLAADGVCILLKGQNFKQELTDSRKRWHINVEIHPSESDSSGRILIIKGLEPIHANP